ncbi:hypothetical protein [Methylocystis rosea]|uniref:hypothetical protein n=1 Tax=Methylocystis rosea TaxID=173366 RepID=UPI0012ECADFC|nr:hypothetical protein [Methylocystis rosea]
MGQPIAPLHSILDALNSFRASRADGGLDEPIEFAPGVAAAFINAGHIPGSASIYSAAHRRVANGQDEKPKPLVWKLTSSAPLSNVAGKR